MPRFPARAGVVVAAAALLAAGCLNSLPSGILSCQSQADCPSNQECIAGTCFTKGQGPSTSSGSSSSLQLLDHGWQRHGQQLQHDQRQWHQQRNEQQVQRDQCV